MNKSPKKPLVSVITVTRNLIKAERKKCFFQCILSVAVQNYENIEHIVIDGASDDGTLDLIKCYSDNIRYISEPDKGLYDAMNKGARLAKGKYLMFLNSDDFLSDEKGIEKSVNALEQGGYDFSYAKTKMVDKQGNRQSHLEYEPNISKVFTLMPFCHQSMLIRKDVFENLGMYDLKYKSAADYDFIYKLVLNKQNSVFVPDEITTFRTGGYSNTDKDLSVLESAKVIQENCSRFYKFTQKECIDMVYTQNMPCTCLFRLIKNTDLGFKNNVKILLKAFRRNFIRIRCSFKNPHFEILGMKIVGN